MCQGTLPKCCRCFARQCTKQLGGGGGWSGGFGLPRSQVNAFPMSKSVMIGFGIVLYIFILL